MEQRQPHTERQPNTERQPGPAQSATGILGFDQRVQYTITKLPSKDAIRDEAAGLREHKNFVWFYTVIRIKLAEFTDAEKKTEIAERLESARKSAAELGEYGLTVLTLAEMAHRGSRIYYKQKGRPLPTDTPADRERAAARFEADFCRNETRALAFLRAFEGMAKVFKESPDNETFLENLAALYPPIETKPPEKK
jgi:hypothetical protein